jgi:hypothetical protein
MELMHVVYCYTIYFTANSIIKHKLIIGDLRV